MKAMIRRLPKRYQDLACAVYFIGEILMGLVVVGGFWLLWGCLYVVL